VHVALVRWANYETGGFDLGFFDQLIYNTAQGRFFENSFVWYNFTGQHFEPVLLLFVPAYWLGAGPLVLTITQAVVAAGSTIVLFFAARRWGLAPWVAASLGLAWMANPYLHRALYFDFHPEVMFALPLFATLWATAAGRPRTAAALALSLLLFKEDAALVTLAVAALLWWRGYRRPAEVTAAAALAWTFVVVLVVMPWAREGRPSDLVDRYGYLVGVSSQAKLLPALLLHPWVIPWQLLQPGHLWTAALLVAVSCPLALGRPWTLTLLVPSLSVALLSSAPDQSGLFLHYGAEPAALATIIGVIGAPRLAGRVPASLLGAAVVVSATLAFGLASPFAPWQSDNTPSNGHRAAVAEALALIPGDESVTVSAQSGLVARLSQRVGIYEFPGHYDGRADWVVVDQYGYRSSQSLADGFDAKLGVVRTTYERVFDRDGVEVFRRKQ